MEELINTQQNKNLQILNSGSCGLNVISGALQTGVKAAEWSIPLCSRYSSLQSTTDNIQSARSTARHG